jgi:hypothetical protein
MWGTSGCSLQCIQWWAGPHEDPGEELPRAHRQHTTLTAVQVPLCTAPGPQGGQPDPWRGRDFNKKILKNREKYDERKKNANIISLLEKFQQGKLLAWIASRPGQCDRQRAVCYGASCWNYLRKFIGWERQISCPLCLASVIKVFSVTKQTSKQTSILPLYWSQELMARVVCVFMQSPAAEATPCWGRADKEVGWRIWDVSP